MEPTTWNIGQFAKRSGTTPDALRYYERLGLLTPSGRSDGGYRRYDDAAVERLGFIRHAQALGLTLAEVRDIIRIAEEGEAPCEHVEATLARHLREVDARMAELRSLRRDIEQVLAAAPKARTGTACICGIIESIERSPGHVKGQPGPVRQPGAVRECSQQPATSHSRRT